MSQIFCLGVVGWLGALISSCRFATNGVRGCLFFLFLLAPSFWVGKACAEPGGIGLCNAKEISLFNCEFAGKQASLCVAGATEPYVQYRFGAKGRIELIYPQQGSVHGNFRMSTTPYRGGGENRVGFSIGRYRYYVFDSLKVVLAEGDEFPVFSSGISVFKDGNRVARFKCLNDSSLSAEAYERFDSEDFDYDLEM